MIKDKPLLLIQWTLIAVEKYLLCRFSKVTFLDIPKVDRDKASLVLMNHFSFNDGFILQRLCRRILKKKMKIMVIEEQMKAFKILRYAGCFSVNKKSRSVAESLNYAASLLHDPDHMLGIFPQGEVYSFHLNRIHFEKGLERILSRVEKPVQIFFAVALLDYLDNFKPHARIYLHEYTGPAGYTAMEQAYNELYRACKIKQQSLHHPPARLIGD